MVSAKKWILVKSFHGDPQPSDFCLQEETLNDSLKDGEVLLEAIFYSVDPYMRIFPQKVGEVMMGAQVAKVLESKNEKYPSGTTVVARIGWRSRTILSDESLLEEIPPLHGLSQSTALGVMGMTGMTAYFGLLEICAPKPGETVLVSGAAGAVGSIVGQIAKIKGCTVIGSAGTTQKCEWLKELGFDHVFNYKEVDVNETLKKIAPGGIDCYFDNVGGDFTTAALNNMKEFGRISLCGSISGYNAKEKPKIDTPWIDFVLKNIRAEGFIVYRWRDRWMGAFKDMVEWIKEGKIKFRETVTEGFEKMPEAFISMLKGGNIGKAIVTP